MKKAFLGKFILILASYVLIIAVCVGVFFVDEYYDTVEKTTASDSQAKAEQKRDILQSKNADLQSTNQVLSSQLSSIQQGLSSTNFSTVTSDTATNPNTDNMVCYLTFDDGPSNNTLKILEILKKENVKATFFVKGTSNMNYLQNIKDGGHVIGLHSDTHTYSQIYKSVSAYYKDLDALKAKIKAKVGIEPNLLRFPGGSSNTTSRSYCRGIMTTLTKDENLSVEAKGYKYFDWNVDTGDALRNGMPVSTLVQNAKNHAKGKALCVLMHDTDAKGTTVQALPQIISYYRSKGYRFEGLTAESPIFHHGINN